MRALIAQGETSRVEFKQSLEYVDPQSPELQRIASADARAKKLNEVRKAVVHSALKSVCAFLNADGGTLLVGVHDTAGVRAAQKLSNLHKKPGSRGGYCAKPADDYKSNADINAALNIRDRYLVGWSSPSGEPPSEGLSCQLRPCQSAEATGLDASCLL